MKENEINILRILYRDPNQRNNTNESLSNDLGIKESVFKESVNSLIEYGYVFDSSDEGQRNQNLTAYKITANGAKKINVIDYENRLGVLIKKYGKSIGIIISVLGLVGIGFQIYFGFREDCWHKKEYKLHQQQFQTNSSDILIYKKDSIKGTCR